MNDSDRTRSTDNDASDEANFAADARSLAGKTAFSRREAITTGLATGFAVAVQPVSAQTQITTNAGGLVAGEVTIPTSSGDIPGYRAMPMEGSAFPVVLVVQEIFGVHEYIKDVCRRLGKAGYFAIAMEMYARQGDVSKLASIDEVRAVVAKVPDAQVMSDLDAAVAFAKASGKADVSKLGITGFCWGGRVTWLYTAHNPDVKAGVAWYGRLVGEPSPNAPKHPLDVVPDLKAPVLGLYGGEDQGIPVATVAQMREACKAVGKTCEIIVYEGAPHAFHADYRPSFRMQPAQDGWRRLLEWLREHGVR